MRRYLIPVSTAIALAAAGCHMSADGKEREAGPKVDRNYQVGAFSKIEVAGPYEVKVVTGGAPGVSARGGENLLDETEVVVKGDTLEIRPKKRKGMQLELVERHGRVHGQCRRAARRLHRRIGRDHRRQGRRRFRGRHRRVGRPAPAGGDRAAGSSSESPGRARSTPPARRTASRSRSPDRATSTPRGWRRGPPMSPSPGRAMSPPTPPRPPTSRSWARATSI